MPARQMRQKREEYEEAREDTTGGEERGSMGCSYDDGANGVKGRGGDGACSELYDPIGNLAKGVVPI